MNYLDGHQIRVGDKVRLGGEEGVVVCDIGAGEFSNSFPEREWAYLKDGIVIQFSKYGVIHMKDAESDLEFISRSD